MSARRLGAVPFLAAGLALAAHLTGAAPAARAQSAGPPRLARGVTAVLLPVQAVRPLSGGGWPGGASSGDRTRARMTAELQHAFDRWAGETGWVPPREVIRQAEQNPALGVDAGAVAAGELAGLRPGKWIPAPLHRQLRRLASLFGARYLMVPAELSYRGPAPGTGRDTAGEAGSSGGAAPAGQGQGPGEGQPSTTGRAALRLVLLDVRRGEVLWRGSVTGRPAPPDSPAALASLAERLARWYGD